MSNIEISEALWSGVPEEEKPQVINHLREHKYLMSSEVIIGNPNIPASSQEDFLGDLNPLPHFCRLACDAAAASAAAAVTLSGPAAVAAYAAIEVGRQACRNGC